jgi:hypothetical protein
MEIVKLKKAIWLRLTTFFIVKGPDATTDFSILLSSYRIVSNDSVPIKNIIELKMYFKLSPSFMEKDSVL